MAKHLETPVTLLTPGTINEYLHYGPYARYWWSSRSTNNNENIFFPIRLGQKTRVFHNNREFIILVVLGNPDHPMQPGYFCSSGSLSGQIESSSTKAISSLYKDIFHNSTKFSGPTIIGQDNPRIIEELSRDVRFIPFQITIDKYKIFVHDLGLVSFRSELHNAGSGYSSSFLHVYNKKQSLFVLKIVDNGCILEIYQQAQKVKIIHGSTPSEVWRKSGLIGKYDGCELYGLKDHKTQNLLREIHIPTCTSNNWDDKTLMTKLFEYHLKRRTISSVNWYTIFDTWRKQESDIFELYSNLKMIYSSRHKFGDRELRAWQALLRAAGAHSITPFSSAESKVYKFFFIYLIYEIRLYILHAYLYFKKYQFWTRASNPKKDQDTFANLYKMGFLVSTPIHMPNSTKKFWQCFDRAISENKKNHDGKRRILSIIADQFTYSQLEKNLKVSVL